MSDKGRDYRTRLSPDTPGGFGLFFALKAPQHVARRLNSLVETGS
jgi:hypothetical protein